MCTSIAKTFNGVGARSRGGREATEEQEGVEEGKDLLVHVFPSHSGRLLKIHFGLIEK